MIARNFADCRSARYEYVRNFEQPDILLANTWIVVRIDGRGFSKYVRFLTFKFFSKVTSHHCFFVILSIYTHDAPSWTPMLVVMSSCMLHIAGNRQAENQLHIRTS
jgi:tRNA(His) 5'-end guanylyltransferase